MARKERKNKYNVEESKKRKYGGSKKVRKETSGTSGSWEEVGIRGKVGRREARGEGSKTKS